MAWHQTTSDFRETIPADIEKFRPNPVTLIVLFRRHNSTGTTDVASKGRALQLRIPGSSVHQYARLVRVRDFKSDAVVEHDIIMFPPLKKNVRNNPRSGRNRSGS